MSTTLAAAMATIRGRWESEVEQALDLPTQYDARDLAEPEGEDARYCRLSIIPGDSAQVTALCSPTGGQQFRTAGIFIASIYFPHGDGDGDQVALAEQAAGKFKAQTVGGVTFRTPSISRVGRAGKWWQVNVTCPWQFDTFSS